MSKMLRLFLLSLLCVTFVSCSKSDSSDDDAKEGGKAAKAMGECLVTEKTAIYGTCTGEAVLKLFREGLKKAGAEDEKDKAEEDKELKQVKQLRDFLKDHELQNVTVVVNGFGQKPLAAALLAFGKAIDDKELNEVLLFGEKAEKSPCKRVAEGSYLVEDIDAAIRLVPGGKAVLLATKGFAVDDALKAIADKKRGEVAEGMKEAWRKGDDLQLGLCNTPDVAKEWEGAKEMLGVAPKAASLSIALETGVVAAVSYDKAEDAKALQEKLNGFLGMAKEMKELPEEARKALGTVKISVDGAVVKLSADFSAIKLIQSAL